MGRVFTYTGNRVTLSLITFIVIRLTDILSKTVYFSTFLFKII